MGVSTFGTELYNAFRSSEFFGDAVFAIEWTEDNGSSFDPITGTVTPNTITHNAQCFSVSSGDKSQQPKSMSFDDVQIDDQFAKTLTAELKTPPNGTSVQWKGATYTVVETITDPISLTAMIQLRK